MNTTVAPARRISSVDILRGLLMIVMALDHTRDFFTNTQVDPTDPLKSWPALFFTRWITHLCAPGFVALAGTSVYLQRARGRTATELASKLVTRGLWLIFVELAVVSFGLFFTYGFHFMQVIWAVGASMIVLALLQMFPVRVAAIYGVVVLALHNLLDPIQAKNLGGAYDVWILLHQQGMMLLHGKPLAFVAYPVLPWTGVIAVGYAFGIVVLWDAEKRRRWCVRAGLVFLASFGSLRWFNLYGDAERFQHLQTATQSAMSFFNVTKYPPSLLYLLATFGVLLLLFVAIDWAVEHRVWSKPLSVVEVYGRVPFFYYVPHFYLIHLLAIAVQAVRFGTTHFAWSSAEPGTLAAHGWGFSLPMVYVIWISVVASLYYPCLWFSRVKARRRDWWLSYL